MINGRPDDSGLKATYPSSISSDATEETSESESESSELLLEELDEAEEADETDEDRLRFLTGSSSSSIARKSEVSLAASSSESALF
jgi:hypothetical protein